MFSQQNLAQLRQQLARLLSGADRQLDPQERRKIVGELFYTSEERARYLRRFSVLMALSVIIASLGIRSDSTAVVIGAMLIAPLMTPVLAVAASIVMGWPERLMRSLVLLGVASVGAVLLSWAIQTPVPEVPETVLPDELLSRTRPNPLDLGIALAAGAAGAYVQVRREALAALPGVAIAVALVPPLAAAGIAMELGQLGLAGGALLLYVTNLAAIVLAASVVYLVSGFTPLSVLARARRRVQISMVAAVAGVVIVLVPLTFNAVRIINEAREDAATRSVVLEWLGDDSRLDIIDLEVDGDEVELVLAGPEEPPTTEPLVAELAGLLGEPLAVRVRWAPVTEVLAEYGGEGGATELVPESPQPPGERPAR